MGGNIGFGKIGVEPIPGCVGLGVGFGGERGQFRSWTLRQDLLPRLYGRLRGCRNKGLQFAA